MADLQFSKCSEILTLEDFQKIEGEMGIIIPQDLKEHYLKFNGGYPSKTHFDYGDEFDRYSITVHYFYSFSVTEHNNGFGINHFNLNEQSGIRDKPRYPNYLLPFAVDIRGIDIAYNLKNNQIYLYYIDDWSQEISIAENFERVSELIAGSLSEFLENLIEDD